MDIHRSRFVPFNPSAINALAFSHTKAEHGGSEPESLRLAIGRANGNIEIWNPANGAWLQEKVFSGGKDRSVEGLVWIQEPDQKSAQNKNSSGRLRLFSIGYSSSVTEWDLASGLPLRHSNGNHSEIWCFAAQPRTKNSHQKLVAGCADGTVVLLSTEDDDLIFDRFVSRATNKKARALSITFKDDDIVLAGFADSTIRVFDTRNSTVIRNISLGSGPQGGPKEILVWKVKCLSNGYIVSGDSTGDIRIYNGKNYSQIQRISGHEADILDLAVSQDGTSIFSAGMDRRTCFYTSKKGAAQGQNGKWRKVQHKRYHEHDVKALATYEGNKLSVLVSGGIDAQPITVPIREFGKELSLGLPALPPTPPLVSAPDARLLVSWWATEVRIWRVKPQDDRTEKPKVVARLALQGEENITSVTISQDGRLLVVATASAVKIFQVLQLQSGAGASLRIRKLDAPLLPGAKLVKLATNGKWLTIITSNNDICLVRIVRGTDLADTPRVLDTVQHLRRQERQGLLQSSLIGALGPYERSITHVDFSVDGNALATVDLAGYIDTWVIEGYEDLTVPEVDIDDAAAAADEDADSASDSDSDSSSESGNTKKRIVFLGQSWIRNPSGHLLPRINSIPVLLSFQPSLNASNRLLPNRSPAIHPTRNNPHPHSHEILNKDARLLVVSADHELHLFELKPGRLSDWSRRNPSSSYPNEYKQLDSTAKGCVWDVSETEQRIWLYGERWLFMFDLTKDFATSRQSSKKRKRDSVRNHSGAGGVVPVKEVSVTKVKKSQSGQVEESKWIDVNAITSSNHVIDEDEADDSLANMRRSITQGGEQTNGSLEDAGNELVVAPEKRSEPWWHTFKYRPILGIVPMSGDDSHHAPEVVLVERPIWDFDLPPRFVGKHE